MPRRAPALLAAALLAPVGLLAACSADVPDPRAGATATTTTADTTTSGDFTVVTAVYPLEYAVQRIGGARVQAVNLAKPGTEPHDLELTPADVAAVESADLVVYLKGLSPAFDDAVAQRGGQGVLEVGALADLTAPAAQEVGHAQAAHTDGTGAGGTGTEGAGGHSHADGELDPHFWLDPLRYQKVVQGISAELGRLSQVDRQDYDSRTNALSQELTTLDGDFAAGLRQCTSRNLVTGHAAFGYLAARYGLHQVSIAGLAPEGEPDPATIAAVTTYVRAKKVTTIYTEPLVSPAIAETVAKEAGVNTAVLDPLESLTDTSAGSDYLEVMRANLATLQKGQGCS